MTTAKYRKVLNNNQIWISTRISPNYKIQDLNKSFSSKKKKKFFTRHIGKDVFKL